MAYTAYSGELVPFRSSTTVSEAAKPRRGILRRILNAIYESRRKKAELDIARFLERRGGRITDEIERQMTERLLRGDWRR
jgi:hypothetical protein